jgi:hypothetical protein
MIARLFRRGGAGGSGRFPAGPAVPLVLFGATGHLLQIVAPLEGLVIAGAVLGMWGT